MATEAFQPVREDGRPYWQVIYDEIVARMTSGNLKVGDIVSHDDLSRMLDGLPHYQPTAKAAQHLREHHRRNLMIVRGIGYKLVAGMDQVGQAKTLQRKSHRTLVKASRVVSTVDHGLLSPTESAMATQVYKGMAVLAGMVKMTAVKIAEHEEEIELLKSAKAESNARHRATEDEMAELRRRLDELEHKT
jgi:exoribonuclease II